MDCPNLKLKYQNLLVLRERFQLAYDRFKELQTASVEERNIAANELKELSTEIQEIIKTEFDKYFEYKSFKQLSTWLKTETVINPEGETVSLESRLEGGSLEALINQQEIFYQKMYGSDFKIDRSKIQIKKERLKCIKAGFENGSVNFLLITAIPNSLSEKEKQMTEAEYIFYKLLAPLKSKGLKVLAEEGSSRLSGLTIEELLRAYIPVEPADFDLKNLKADWQEEITRVIDKKQEAPKVCPGKINLCFTDKHQDIPKNQRPINQNGDEVKNNLFYFIGDEVKNNHFFFEMIKNKVKVLSPAEWLNLAAQLYDKDQCYLSRNFLDMQMAIFKNIDGINPSVSVAYAGSDTDGLCLNSGTTRGSYVDLRWRNAL